jgi:hypothetical protein
VFFRFLGIIVTFFACTSMGATVDVRCPDLSQPIELGKLGPEFVESKYKTLQSHSGMLFPSVTLSQVKFDDHPTVKKMEQALATGNGGFSLEISPVLWTGGKPRFSRYQVGARVLGSRFRDFVGLPRAITQTLEGERSVYGKISRESSNVILIENEYYLGGSMAYASRVRISEGRIINIEFRYPDAVEASALYTSYKEHKTVCVKSYDRADIQPSE